MNILNMNTKKILLLNAILISFFIQTVNAQNFNTDNLDIKIENKISTILNSMTLEEKVGQTCQITLESVLKKNKDGKLIEPHQIDNKKLKIAIKDFKVGSFLNVSNHTFTIEKWHKVINKIQNYSKLTKHQIPVIYGVDAIHGATYIQNSTLFPQEIGLAATWDLNHAKKMAEITAYETRASGIPWNFSPVLDLGRNPIWSRFFETLGEDVYLATEMGKSIIDGYQGGKEIDDYHVAACLKHYVGYGVPESGRDRTPALIPNRTMEEYHLPPFYHSIKNGALTVMVNSGEVNGIPGHANKYLLTDILKEKWGFKGFAVSDWEDFINLYKVAQTDSTLKDAIATAINAGVDMSMVPNNPEYKTYCKLLIELVNEGRVSQVRLDDAVRRILRVKNQLGLLNNYKKPNIKDYNNFASDEYRKAAYDAASESITLLKNNNILPISKEKSVLLIGPTANSLNCLNGAWTHTWQGVDDKYNNDFPTIKDAIQSNYSNFAFFEGSKLIMENKDEKDVLASDLQLAIEQAKSFDVAIVCLGELPSTERPGDIYTLDLPKEQQLIVTSLADEGIPIVLVLVQGRPKIIRDIEKLADGIILAYLPGDQGGAAIADIIAGKINPSGKLPFTYPKYNGVKMHYDHKQSEVINANTWKNDFYDPQWDFGFGLSYTDFEYSNLRINKKTISNNDELSISVDITNKGQRKGKEVVQLYMRDHFATISPPLKKLRRFSKIDLSPQETKTVTFTINSEDLKFYGINNEWIVEDGKFSIMIDNLKQDFVFKN
ncbi:MAG: glycoside hydrolase family 3 N-terminal domain-containing protein [Bacteroidota bacterium]|nr:glycoside hydrolase family 3 N-terminal domain-containing protein [Bacteroidota bacterium]